MMQSDSFIEDGLLWQRLQQPAKPDRIVIYAPPSMRPDIICEAHGTVLAGHNGQLKTKERILQTFYWPGMDANIQHHLRSCHQCQLRRTDDHPPPLLLTSLPQTTEPNQRVHADLFGPLFMSGRHKKYVLCITDAFTKYVELVALENKEADTVAESLFKKWFCWYGNPLDVVTNRGKEFCAKLSEALFKKLGTSHLKTAPYHPQCNSQAEVANKTIQKYLNSFVNESTLDWELYLAPLMFSYNTSFNRSILNTPHDLTIGQQARQPIFIQDNLKQKFYGKNLVDEKLQRLQLARRIAQQNSEMSAKQAKF